VIVFIGHPLAADAPDGRRPAGTTALAAIDAAAGGAVVQLVGKVGDDPAGDEVVLALAAAGVGHVALLRDPARRTPVQSASTEHEDVAAEPRTAPIRRGDADERPALEAADVELGLRYLTDFRGVIVAEPLPEAVVRVAADAAGYAGAELVVVTDGDPPTGLPATAVALATPGRDTEGAFAALLGRIGAAIEGGSTAADALASSVAGLGAVRAE
jgi:sugar/nucleoside kinase (ribokinase family)